MRLSEFFSEAGRPVAYYPKLCPLLGGVHATLLFCQFVYWHGKGREADGSIYKTMQEITEETGLSRREQETARKVLRKLSLLTERYARLDHRMFYTIHLDVLDSLWESSLRPSTPKAESAIRECTNPPFGTCAKRHSLSEIPSEITSKDYLENHNGVFRAEPAKNTPPRAPKALTGYFLENTPGSPYEHEVIDSCLTAYYQCYRETYGCDHPRLKAAQLERIYTCLDEAFAALHVQTAEEACEYAAQHFARDQTTDGNLNAFAQADVLRYIAYELGNTAGYEGARV